MSMVSFRTVRAGDYPNGAAGAGACWFYTSFGCFAVATAAVGALAVLILGAVFGLPAILRKLGAVESAAKCREAAVAGIVAPAVITIFWSLLFLPIDGPRCP